MPTEIVHRSCPICEATCGLRVHVDRAAQRVVRIDGDFDDPRSRGFVCPKSQAMTGVYEDPDRLRRPLRRIKSGFEEISWDAAFDLAGERLRSLREEHGPLALGCYIGNPTSASAGAVLYTTPFMRTLGTPRVFTAATMDQFPKNVSSRLLYGSAGILPIPDIDRTDLLLILGANPLVSQGSIMSAPDMRGRLRRLRERGGRLVVIDPRRTETAAAADQHFFIRPGGDALLLFALVHVLFEEGLAEPGRVGTFTDGLERVRELALDYSPEQVAPAIGIAAEKIRQLARELSAAPRAAVYGRIGTCVQEFGALSSWLVDVVTLLTGNLDEPGGAMFPRSAAGQLEPSTAKPRPMAVGRYRTIARNLPEIEGQLPAISLVEEIDAAGDQRIRGLVTIAGNPVLSIPGGPRLAKALEGLDFMLSVDIYLNETTRHADLILPSTVHLEDENYDLLFETTTVRNFANYSPRVFEPPEDARHHWQILLELAARMSGTTAEAFDDGLVEQAVNRAVRRSTSPCHAADPEAIREQVLPERGPMRLVDIMLRSGPWGDGFGAKPGGLSLEKLRASPQAEDLGALERRLPELLRTEGRRIDLAPDHLVADVPRLKAWLDAAPAGEGLVLIGRRQLRNMNSWLHNLPVLAKGRERCTLLICPTDARRLAIADGREVRIKSRSGELTVTAEISDEMMPGVVSLPHGFGHRYDGTRLSVASTLQPGASLNDLTDPERIDVASGTGAANGVPVEVEPIGL